ncbi:MAG: DUF1127 domain-containing protein [Tabrizicola sp.]|nr:DUF1127 domain-containing protein [Tabrizicola sp.]
MPRTQIRRLPLQGHTGLLGRFARFLQLSAARRQSRQKLALLDEHLLRDIGLDTHCAAEECAKPFWRA